MLQQLVLAELATLDRFIQPQIEIWASKLDIPRDWAFESCASTSNPPISLRSCCSHPLPNVIAAMMSRGVTLLIRKHLLFSCNIDERELHLGEISCNERKKMARRPVRLAKTCFVFMPHPVFENCCKKDARNSNQLVLPSICECKLDFLHTPSSFSDRMLAKARAKLRTDGQDDDRSLALELVAACCHSGFLENRLVAAFASVLRLSTCHERPGNGGKTQEDRRGFVNGTRVANVAIVNRKCIDMHCSVPRLHFAQPSTSASSLFLSQRRLSGFATPRPKAMSSALRVPQHDAEPRSRQSMP